MHPHGKLSWILVYDLLNITVGQRFTPNDLSLENIRPTPGAIDPRATTADFISNPCGQYFNDFVVTYNRLDLATEFANVNVIIPFNGGDNTHDLISYINKTYHYKFTESDFIKTFYRNEIFPFQVTLVATENNPAWVGSVTVSVIENAPRLGEVFANPDLRLFDYPTKELELIQGRILLAEHDYSDHALALVQMGYVDTTEYNPFLVEPSVILPIINSKANPTWSANPSLGQSPWNLTHHYYDDKRVRHPKVAILYNGPVTTKYTQRVSYDHICVVRIPASSCSNVFGHLILYYNL